MRLFVTVKLKDEKTIATYECVNFPWVSDGYLVLCLDNFERKWILNETILEVSWKFKK